MNGDRTHRADHRSSLDAKRILDPARREGSRVGSSSAAFRPSAAKLPVRCRRHAGCCRGEENAARAQPARGRFIGEPKRRGWIPLVSSCVSREAERRRILIIVVPDSIDLTPSRRVE